MSGSSNLFGAMLIHHLHLVAFHVAAGLQLFAWASIAMFAGVSSTATILTAFLTITNFGGGISEVVQDAMLAEAGKNKVGAQQGISLEGSICSLSSSVVSFFSPLLLSVPVLLIVVHLAGIMMCVVCL